MGAESLAARIGCDPGLARELLALHRAAYPMFWRWSDAAVDYAYQHNLLHTVYGWPLHLGPEANPRSIRNFPMQANGAEMLRLACCLATERGIRVCAPVHDAVLIEAPADAIDAAVATMQAAMADASRFVLGGALTLRSEASVVDAPGRVLEERGRRLWELVQTVLGELVAGRAGAPAPGEMSTGAPPSHLLSLSSRVS
jgi:hypothetical protein